MRDYRIKSVIFPEMSGNATTVTQFSNEAINGEMLRVTAFANFTGSLILKESGTNVQFCNYTVTSGTNTWNNTNFTNTTGSYCMNSNLMLVVESLASGTAVKFGPVNVTYR